MIIKLIILFGIIFRVHQYLVNRSLWLDETHLAMNIINRNFLELTQKLDYNQAAPILFLWIEKLFVNIFGNNEFAFRAFPLICGILSIFLFYLVLKEFFDKKIITIGLLLFCVCDQLIYYSSELKQYSTDVFICLILYFLAIVAQKKNYNIFYVILFGIIGSISIWISHPSIFILLSIGIVLIIKEKRQFFKFLIPLFMCIISFVFSYYVSLTHIVDDKVLLQFASTTFAPFPPKRLADIEWYIRSFFLTIKNPVSIHLKGMGAFSFVVGLIAIYKYNKTIFFYSILPIIFTLLASMVHKYPFSARLILFLVPCFLIFISAGAKEIINKTPKLIGITFTIILLFHPVLFSLRHLAIPRYKGETREIIKYLMKNKRNGDKVYVYLGSVETSFKYYAIKYNYKEYVEGVDWIYLRNVSDYMNEINKFVGNNRVWFIFPHLIPAEAMKDEQIFIYCLNSVGKLLDCYRKPSASIYLYDLSVK